MIRKADIQRMSDTSLPLKGRNGRMNTDKTVNSWPRFGLQYNTCISILLIKKAGRLPKAKVTSFQGLSSSLNTVENRSIYLGPCRHSQGGTGSGSTHSPRLAALASSCNAYKLRSFTYLS